MPKYLIKGAYSREGVDGLLKEGGSKRRKAIIQAVEGMGGTVEACYFAFGETDLYTLIDVPDNVTAAALSLISSAAGTTKATTLTVLITPEEMDKAVTLAQEKSTAYRPPGR